MSTTLLTTAVIIFALGVLFKYLTFRKEQKNIHDKKFWKSSIMLGFVADVIIIFLGQFVAMNITEWENDVKERERAVFMLEEARDFAVEQHTDHLPYFDEYIAGDITMAQLEIYAAIDLEYFRDIVSDDSVKKCLETHTYGVFCNYINYLEVIEQQIDSIDAGRADLKYSMLLVRRGFYGKLIRVLDVCALEAKGDLSDQEYARLIALLDEEKVEEYTPMKAAEDYLIDRSALKESNR